MFVPRETASYVGGEPNITGETQQGVQLGGDDKGALSRKYAGAGVFNNNSAEQGSLHFDAGISNAYYGKSTTVQPPALTLLPGIKF